MRLRKTRHRNARRRGSMYITVLGTTVAVALLGLSGLMAVRVERRSADDSGDFARARLYARSAIEMGLLRIENNADWRTVYSNLKWESDKQIGSGSYTLEGIDPVDGILSDDDTDPVQLTGTGMQGDARYKLQVTLLAEMLPLSCLEVSMHAKNDLIFNSSTVNSDQIVSANDSVSASGSTVNANVEAVTSITGSGYTGTTTTGIAPRDVPSPSSVFDYYVSNGTAITLPGESIENVLLSPNSNPYGTTDPNGIYVVDCQFQNISIQNARIVGTLVLLNAGPGSQIQPKILAEPAVANYPTLMVRGSFNINTGAAGLQESAGLNFNPPGTPYEGVTDTDETDVYPPVIKGLVYVSANLTTGEFCAVQGAVVVGDTLTGEGNLELTYQQTFLDDPPPGFRQPVRMLPLAGSWERVVD